MALPGELLGLRGARCPDCGKWLVPCVCNSNAGYYLGYFCCCGPLSRETGYYLTPAKADAQLAVALAGGVPEGVRL